MRENRTGPIGWIISHPRAALAIGGLLITLGLTTNEFVGMLMWRDLRGSSATQVPWYLLHGFGLIAGPGYSTAITISKFALFVTGIGMLVGAGVWAARSGD
jgi:hypothetical protein